ncbi:Putative serine/threonine-protein kinase [Durusdinium trenchii]|uniref:Serine/threonine-protein kinase n=1 Tax=Durusdinium trenchii TaxID=1381693 RepID=A0ABP0L6U6_9DINO
MHTLRNFGVLWRASPLDMKDEQRLELWNRTRKVNEFDVFLSHTWHTRGLWKFLSLSLQLSWLQILLWNYAAEIDWHIWGSSLAPAVSVMCFLITPYMPCMRDKHCFLDVASINQSDETLKERGIYGLGGFLKASKELRIMWSPPYLSRLWCIFEVAAYRMANPNGKISVRPLFVDRLKL